MTTAMDRRINQWIFNEPYLPFPLQLWGPLLCYILWRDHGLLTVLAREHLWLLLPKELFICSSIINVLISNRPIVAHWTTISPLVRERRLRMSVHQKVEQYFVCLLPWVKQPCLCLWLSRHSPLVQQQKRCFILILKRLKKLNFFFH